MLSMGEGIKLSAPGRWVPCRFGGSLKNLTLAVRLLIQ
jgi:hypothetical protein